VTEEVYRLLNTNYDLVCRGKVSVKGKGEMLTYFLEGKVQGVGTVTTSSVIRSASLARRIHSCGKASVQTNLVSVSSVASLTIHAGVGARRAVAGHRRRRRRQQQRQQPRPSQPPAVVPREGGEDRERLGRIGGVTEVVVEAVVAEIVGDGAV
ncbi:hypothetical protein CRUP_030426, partial [Coryphaenoides rupestris]